MATDFILPRLPGQQQQNPFYTTAQQQQHHHQHYYQHPQQQQPSFQPSAIHPAYPAPALYSAPVSPLGTPGSISPTTSKTQITRQIRRPLYVPAVLRPTEFPSKEPPAQPKPQDEDYDSAELGLRPNSSFMSLGGLSAFSRLSRRSTGDSTKSLSTDWDLDRFPNPTGAPTREHWKPDQESTMCDHATCKRNFSYFTRRHHCRKCGNIFCDQHSAFEIPLDQDANFNPRGTPSRACGYCYSQFREWCAKLRASSPGAAQTSADGDHHHHYHHSQQILATPTSSPLAASPTVGFGAALPTTPTTPDAAHSVPRDWNWSTF